MWRTLACCRLCPRLIAVSARASFGVVLQRDLEWVTPSRRFEMQTISVDDALPPLLPFAQPFGTQPFVSRVVKRELAPHLDRLNAILPTAGFVETLRTLHQEARKRLDVRQRLEIPAMLGVGVVHATQQSF